MRAASKEEIQAMSTGIAVSRTGPGSAGAVKTVSVISTGTADPPRTPLRHPQAAVLVAAHLAELDTPRPINVYVIEHARGLILFDTGQDRASVTDSTYFPAGFTGYLYDRLARFDIGEEHTLTAQLAALGYAPADVGTAILSHLHQDHIGGLAELKDASLLVSAAEWAELARPGPELHRFRSTASSLPWRPCVTWPPRGAWTWCCATPRTASPASSPARRC